MRLFPLILLLAALVFSLPASSGAQTAEGTVETPELMLERWEAEADFIDQFLDADELDETLGTAEIDALRATLEDQRETVPDLIAATEAKLEPLRRQLTALGEPPEDTNTEVEEVATQRATLTTDIGAQEALLKRAGQADARASAQIAALADLRRKLFSRALLSRGPGLFDAGVPRAAAESIARTIDVVRGETHERVIASRMGVPFFARTVLPLVLIGVALFLVLGVKRAATRWLLRPAAAGAPDRRRVGTAIAVTLVRLLVPALALVLTLAAIWNSSFLGPEGEDLVRGLARTLMVVIGAYALGGAFYAPHTPHLRLSALPEDAAAAAHRWMMALAAIVGLDRVLVGQGEELGLAIEAQSLLNAALLVLGGIAVWGFAGHLRAAEAEQAAAAVEPLDETEDLSGGTVFGPWLVIAARTIARTVALLAPILALIGYFATSRFVFYPVVFSGAVIGICILLFYAVQDLVDALAAPEADAPPAQSRIRLIPIAVGLLLFSGALPVLALIWGADTTDLSASWRMISDGFAVGDIVISPLDFFSFLLVFSIGYVLTRIIQGFLSRSVLPYSGLDAGGKALIRAGVGYVGITLAALVAIATTGLDLSNLAIVAGALSVGIGFGLQNVVNNFVSGLILLVERPIKAGDWVELASGMGYVKKVNVRSTEIQTFDRASLFVPNSELISSTVTNWTHSDLHGRLIVPIGVAYGTDPKQVETILLEIAKAHPMLLRHPAPYVLFRRFGADSLDFEIRGVLRDVNWILNVTSEINFEISRRFTEEGIEIPFAQRDLHLRNADELGRSIGDALRGGDAPQAEAPEAPPQPRRPSGSAEAAGHEPDGDG
jgi:small-conductance mechanosensitive channel